MKICIPSKWRPSRITTKQFFNNADIYLFVEPNEISEYTKNNPECNIVSINNTDWWIWYARSFIVNYIQQTYPEDEIVLIIDDDITIIYDEERKEKMSIKDIEEMFYMMWKKIIDEDLWLCWLYLKNMVRMKNKSKWNYNDKTSWLNVINIKKLKTLNINYSPKIRIYEDIDLLIQLLTKQCQYVVCSSYSFDNYSFKERTAGKWVWGCSLDWDRKRTEDAVIMLLNRRGSDIIKPKTDKQWYCNFTVNRRALKSFTKSKSQW